MAQDLLLLGGLVLDRYFSVTAWPRRGQDGYFSREETFVGGCAANMAVTIHNLGGQAHVVSCLGDDPAGETIRRYWAAHGLSQRFLPTQRGETGSCLVFSEPDGERTFLTRKGVELAFPPDLAAQVAAARPAWVGVTGYYLLGEDRGRVLRTLSALREQGTGILFDPSPLVGDIPPAQREEMVALAHLLTPNDSELAALGGPERISQLTAAGKTVLWKQGSRGGLVCAPTEQFPYAPTPCTPVDTTGAGDSFSGGLLFALAQGRPLDEAVRVAAWCAAQTVQVHGPHGFWQRESGTPV